MLDYLKKLKTFPTKAGSETKSPVLTPDDEKFLESALNDENVENVILPGTSGTTTPITPIAEEPIDTKEAGQGQEEAKKEDKVEAKKEEEKKDGEWMARFQGLTRSISSAAQKKKAQLAESRAQAEEKKKAKEKEKEKLKAQKEKEKEEAEKKKKGKEKTFEREEDELTAVLDQLNLAAEDGRAFSMSTETKELLNRFTQILKDIQTGVPTAYDDLTSLLDNSSQTLEKTYSSLPGFLKKLIKTLPSKITPEVLQTAAAASPALATEGTVVGLRELIKKPGLLMGMLKSVVNVLKTRFPALLGVNAVLSMALFVVLLVLWYCHKRGKEVRMEIEEKQRAGAETEVTPTEVEVVGGEAQTTNDPQVAEASKS